MSSGSTPRSADRGSTTAAPRRTPDTGRDSRHEVTIVDGRFTIARCSCGWTSAGRRHRSTVRLEARDHALLYADASLFSSRLDRDE